MERKFALPLALIAALFMLAGGYIHLQEWLDVYRDVPSSVPGAWVVKVGFPVNVAVSVLLALALVACAVWRQRWLPVVAGVAIAFQLATVAAAVISRQATLFGWTEERYDSAVKQTFAVQAGAVLALLAVIALELAQRRRDASAHEMQAHTSRAA